MTLTIDVTIDMATDEPVDILLQIEAAATPSQAIVSSALTFDAAMFTKRKAGEDGIGERMWFNCHGPLSIRYQAEVDVRAVASSLETLSFTPVRDLPPDAIHYLMPSRNCPSDKFELFAAAEFGDLAGGAKAIAIRDWIARNVAYAPGSSTSQTTAVDTFIERQGVCRDFAHLVIALARASSIPARYASVYSPDVVPQDFHAVAQLYLDGAWHMVDATGMARVENTAVIGVGADAVDVAFLTSFGAMDVTRQSVSVLE